MRKQFSEIVNQIVVPLLIIKAMKLVRRLVVIIVYLSQNLRNLIDFDITILLLYFKLCSKEQK